MRSGRKGAAALAAFFLSFSAYAIDKAALERLASDDNDEKIAAIGALVAEGDPKAAEVLRSAAEGEIEVDGKKIEIVVNNRVRGQPVYGPYAIGTSAYAPGLTDWPGGGVIGIHGTNQPSTIPGRPSHGCIRLQNGEISKLFKLMPIGTPR